MGFALGTLIAILPTLGLGVFIGLGLILIFKKVSKVSMLIAFIIWNPLILALMYPLDYAVGDFILRGVPVKTYKTELLNKLFVYSRRFIVGGIINGIVISIISYIIVLYFAYRYQRKRAKGLKEEIIKLEETLEIN